MSGAAKCIAGDLKKSPTDAAAFMERIDKEGPNRTVARITRRKPQDLPVFFPDPDARMLGEPRVILSGYQGWIPELVLPHGKADLGDAAALIVASAANMPGHRASLSLELAGE